MLDGINYYPKRKKRLKLKLFLLLLLILMFLGIWYYFKDIEIGGTRSTSIIISEPSNFENSEGSIHEITWCACVSTSLKTWYFLVVGWPKCTLT